MFEKMLKRLRGSEKAQGLVEYGLILALISAVAISSVGGVGDKVKSTFDNVANGTGVVEGGEVEDVVKTYIVTFKDDDGTVIKTVDVAEGESATEPEAPSKEGYTFVGWNGSFKNVKSDVEVTPEFNINTYTVNFVSSNGENLGVRSVNHGDTVVPPSTTHMVISNHFEFSWDKPLESIVSDMRIVGVVDLKSEYKAVDYVGSIHIGTPYELQAINNDSVSRDKNYIQIKNIDLSVIEDFVPITVFTGSYDGGRYVIDNLSIDQPSKKGMGLFGWARGATIKNVALTNVNVKGNNAVGGLVGLSIDTSITNSYSEGSVIGESIYIGGLVGGMIDNTLIENSYARGTVKGRVETGGLVGVIEPDGGSIVNSYAQSKVDVDASRHGGLVGANYYTHIKNSGWDKDLCEKGLGWNDREIVALTNTKGYSSLEMSNIIDGLIK